MWTIEEMKARGKDAFKKNYWPSVVAAFILSVLAGGTGAAISNSSSTTTVTTTDGTLESIPPETMAIIATAVIGTVLLAFAVSLLLKIFLFNPLETGCNRFFKKNVENPPAPLGLIGESFNDYGRVFMTMFLRDLFTSLWTLLLIVPGIMKAYSYRMVPFIVKDNPELTPQEVLALSTKMMAGNRWQSFKMDFSFIGWLLLGILTLNVVNLFWTFPYMYNTNAALYLKLKEQM
ncbi:MAG: DUF975 family protein [Atopobiaceae bacterium]|nr:DUF975 family protein [Atopobiaceae bacterium]